MLASLFALLEASIRCSLYLPILTPLHPQLLQPYTRMAARIITLSKTSTTFPSEASKNVFMVSVWMLVSIPESEHALVTRWGIAYLFS